MIAAVNFNVRRSGKPVRVLQEVEVLTLQSLCVKSDP